ncbi:TIGR03086 family metal-binding protein [Rhodococcus sp. NPDC058532]|uniref:TIGR03086 family metal-binding protein n=1 Tax=Rhodococcus sp. NPDC058532 TaxID=3346540 RepID=UPI00364EDB2E
MTIDHDLGPAAGQVSGLIAGVREDHLSLATPCEQWTVDDLLRHLLDLTAAFAAAASKAPYPAGVSGGLAGDWRNRLDTQLDDLVAAWRTAEAWEGDASAGGVTMPAPVMGVVALDELVLHGWDLAQATGQPYDADPASVRACLGFAASMSVPGEEAGREGLYGPVVPVPDDAPDLVRLLGFAGRDPGDGWRDR